MALIAGGRVRSMQDLGSEKQEMKKAILVQRAFAAFAAGAVSWRRPSKPRHLAW